jgi:hypothetical protein
MDAHSGTRLFTYWTEKGLFPFKWWRMACDKLRHQMNASLVRVQNLYTSLPTCGVDFGGHVELRLVIGASEFIEGDHLEALALWAATRSRS